MKNEKKNEKNKFLEHQTPTTNGNFFFFTITRKYGFLISDNSPPM